MATNEHTSPSSNLEKSFLEMTHRANLFYGVVGGGLDKKFLRIRRLGMRYLLYGLVRQFKIKTDIQLRLFWGKNIELPFPDIDTKYLYYFGALGQAEAALTNFFIRNLSANDVFYDVGANYGFYTHLAREILTEGECHAFEPDLSTFSYLRRNFQENDASLWLNNVALSDVSGTIPFFSARKIHASGVSTTSQEASSIQGRNYDHGIATAITLDDYLKNHTKPTFLKVDIEGGEYEFLVGAQQFLTENAPVVALEVIFGVQGRVLSKKVIDLLGTLGYRPHKILLDGSVAEINEIDVEKEGVVYENFIFKK